MPHLYRKDDGQPIRAAMRAAGLSGPQLAEATREVDPEGKGISPAAVGRVAGKGETAQERTRLRTAWLMSLALKEPVQDLFDLFRMPAASTVTVERSIPDAPEE